MGDRGMHTGFWWQDLWEGDHLEDIDIDGRIILKMNLQEMVQGHGLDWVRAGGGRCECGN